VGHARRGILGSEPGFVSSIVEHCEPMEKLPVTVLGATGLVGQRFVARLAEHPWFELAHLAAGPRSVGRSYGEAVRWSVPGRGIPAAAAGLRLVAAEPGAAPAPVVFSALGAERAREVEPAFARAGAVVFSNASAFRLAGDVPLLVPEVNPEHAALLRVQRAAREWPGAIVCNPNCTTAILACVLAPLQQAFGVRRVLVTSLQAASGAGAPGVPGEELRENVLPSIPGEEAKLAAETLRLFGSLRDERVQPAPLVLSAACHRVPVVDGHTLAVSCELAGDPPPEVVRETLRSWRALPQELDLPSSPAAPLRVHDAEDRPQPRLDVDADGGMTVHVGRIRRCPVLGAQFVVLGHNLERGAAGGSLSNAELFRARGWLG